MIESKINCKLVLVDEVQEVVVDGGALRPIDTDEQRWKNKALLNQLEEAFGKCEEFVRYKPRSRTGPQRFGSHGGSHQFGGHEVLTHTLEVVFALGSAGVIKHGFGTLQKWLQLRGKGRVIVEVKEKGGKTRRVDISGYSEAAVRRMLRETRDSS
jgi:hypothetical protein